MLVAFTDKNHCFHLFECNGTYKKKYRFKIFMFVYIPIVFSELHASVVFDIYIDDFSSRNFSGCYVTQERNLPELINDPTDI